MRFPGFEGEWEKTILGQIADVTKLAGYEFTKYVHYEDSGKVIALRGLNCKNGRLVLDDVKYIDNSDLSKLNRSKLFIGDVLFTYVGTVGEVAIIEENDRFYLAPNVSRIRFKDGYNPVFFKAQIGSKCFYDKVVYPLIATSSQPALSMENVRRFSISYPDKKEQDKIASFIEVLEERITIQSKVIERYESLIKALACEVIGKKEPNTLLSDVVKCASSSLKESDLFETGGFPAYGAAGLSGYTEQCLSEKDSILITKDGSGVGSLRYVSGRHSFVGTLNSLTPKEGIYLPYVYYALFNVNFETYRTGQAIPHIYFKDYGKESIYCPAYEDQVRFAKGLELIDVGIEHEKAVLRGLQTVKAYLLSALFI